MYQKTGHLDTRLVGKEITMSEPRLEDDVAFYEECDQCGNFIHTCECDAEDPDRMHDEMHED